MLCHSAGALGGAGVKIKNYLSPVRFALSRRGVRQGEFPYSGVDRCRQAGLSLMADIRTSSTGERSLSFAVNPAKENPSSLRPLRLGGSTLCSFTLFHRPLPPNRGQRPVASGQRDGISCKLQGVRCKQDKKLFLQSWLIAQQLEQSFQPADRCGQQSYRNGDRHGQGLLEPHEL